jgi:hypothetical protein
MLDLKDNATDLAVPLRDARGHLVMGMHSRRTSLVPLTSELAPSGYAFR